jgi:putative flippase GtrA
LRAAVAALESYGFHPRSLRRLSNWIQLVRFCLVGSSGYVLNLAVFSIAVEYLGLQYPLAAVCAYVVAVTNNFTLNRAWTFRGSDGAYTTQAVRYLVVSTSGLGGNLVLLTALVAAGTGALVAQATAIALMTPLTFLLNKLWSFG